jgi:hypothetical protein
VPKLKAAFAAEAKSFSESDDRARHLLQMNTGQKRVGDRPAIAAQTAPLPPDNPMFDSAWIDLEIRNLIEKGKVLGRIRRRSTLTITTRSSPCSP